MKRILAICLCILMFACVPTTQQEETSVLNTTEPDTTATIETDGTPKPQRYPVKEAIAALPETVESINLEDHLLVYESGGATYLYAYGESILLHQGGIFASYGPYNYLTEGTAFTFIEPSDGTLRILDLNDPHKDPVTVDPNAVNGVKRFAISQSGNEILFLKDEGEQDGKPIEALYYYANGETKRIEESVGSVDQFSLSLEGKSYVFYRMDDSYPEYLAMNGGDPVEMDHIEDLSEDFRTVLTCPDTGVLKLYRDGFEPVRLSENCEMYGFRIEPDGTIRWRERDHTFWRFDGTEKVKLLENVESVHVTESGMFVFLRDGSLYAQFDDDAPMLICEKEPGRNVFLHDILEGGSRIVYSTVADDREDADAFLHRTTCVVNVDRNGVSEPTLISDDNYIVLPFRDDWIAVKTEDTVTCDLYFKGTFVGVIDDFWNDYRLLRDAENEVLFFRSEGKLCRFDGETVTVILPSVPKLLSSWVRTLGNGAFLYREGDARYYYDGAAFYRILEGVDGYLTVSFLKDALEERLIHE